MQSGVVFGKGTLASVSLAGLFCLGMLAGCGGGAAPPPKPAQVLPGAASAPASAAIEEAADDSPRQRRPAHSKRMVEDDLDAGEAPGEQAIYQIEGNIENGWPFEIVKLGEAEQPDAFLFQPAPPGVDSSMFVATAPPKLSAPPSSNASSAGAVGGRGKTGETSEFKISEGFSPIPEAGISPLGLPWRLRCDKDGSIMALVPEGTFLQGTEYGTADAAPEHEVFLDSFYIDVTEVTSYQYDTYRAEIRKTKKRPLDPARTATDPQEPVLGVNWGEANAYSHWAGKELPTEAQWEKGARGEHGFRHPWGNGTYLWQRPRSPGQIDKVGSFPGDKSPYGVFDTAGNAREWCADWYAKSYYRDRRAEHGSGLKNPAGPKFAAGGQQRVVKGGDPEWAVWIRTGLMLTERVPDIGFRCVLNSATPKEDSKEKGKKTKPPTAAD